MSTTVSQLILQANALYIGAAGFAGAIFDIRGVSPAIPERTTLQGAR